MLSTICVKQIHSDYYAGQYGNFSVVISKENGYINATKLCSDGGKKFYHWNSTKMALEMTEALRQYIYEVAWANDNDTPAWAISQYQPIGEVSYFMKTLNHSEEDKLVSGTYCHPLLIPHIASWVSPSFALKAASIINYFMAEEWRCRLQLSEIVSDERSNIIEQQNLDLELQKEIHRRLQTNEKIQRERNNVMEQQNQELEQEKEALQAAIKDCEGAIHENLQVVQLKAEVIRGLEDNVVAKISNRQKWASSHVFALLKVNDITGLLPYYTIRCQRSSLSGAIKRLRQRHPRAEVLYHQNRIPNAVNLYTRLKDEGVIKAKRNYCTPNNRSEQYLIERMVELCGTTHPSCNVAPLNAHMEQC